MSEALDECIDAGVIEQVETSASLVPIDDEGTFLVLGFLDEGLGLDVQALPYLSNEQVGRVGDVLANASGWGNLLAQGWQAHQGAVGLVRLAPETLAALRTGATPLAKGGWALGTLMRDGKFAAQVRWAPIGAAGAASALATLGPAFAMVAVQWQLNKIGRAVEQNIELTKTVLDDLRADAWYELDAAARVVLGEAGKAQRLGGVSDRMWAYLQAQSTLPTLLKHRQRNQDDLVRKLDELEVSGNPAEWYQKNFAAVLSHGQAVMTAQQAIALHELMRVAHARRSGDHDDEALAEEVLRSAREEHERCAELVDGSLRALHRALSLWNEADPGETLRLNGRGVPLLQLLEAVAALHQRAITGPFRRLRDIPPPRNLKSHHAVAVPTRERPEYERLLQWVLKDDEGIWLLCKGSYAFGDDEERRLLVVTERRALLVNSNDLLHGRAVITVLPVDAEMTRSLKDGVERVELRHLGRHGLLKTKSDSTDVYEALRQLRARVTSKAGAATAKLAP
jgi:hypothetical protein